MQGHPRGAEPHSAPLHSSSHSLTSSPPPQTWVLELPLPLTLARWLLLPRKKGHQDCPSGLPSRPLYLGNSLDFTSTSRAGP